MWLDEISETTMIVEADDDQSWGRKLYFAYQKAKDMSKPDPIVFYLGLWRMTDKKGNKKKFLCGINLAALSSKRELADLQEHLEDILEPNNMKARYKIGKMLVPHIFSKAYRTYNVKNITSRPLFGRLRALKTTSQDEELAKRAAVKDARPDWEALNKDEQEEEYTSSSEKVWEKLSTRRKDEFREKEISKRGEKDLERIEKAQKERDGLEDYYHELQTRREKEELDQDEEFAAELEPKDEPDIEYPRKMRPLSPGPGVPGNLASAQAGLPIAK